MDFNWEDLNPDTWDLPNLDAPFTEEEVRDTIHHIPNDKVPWSDSFTDAFFKWCWGIIRKDFMRAINHFGNLRATNLPWLNYANIVVLPKKEGVEGVVDNRPISLIHTFAKI